MLPSENTRWHSSTVKILQKRAQMRGVKGDIADELMRLLIAKRTTRTLNQAN